MAPDGSSGRVLMVNSATTLDMLSEYHRPLLNHQAFAEHHHYGLVLALVKTSSLQAGGGVEKNDSILDQSTTYIKGA